MSWDPTQYLKFAAPRLRPAVDLLARVELTAPTRVVDLGCGAGNVTRLLVERWPDARVTGVDSSASMLAEARRAAPDVQWMEQSVADWSADAPVELIFSNAALHWLDHHETLLPRLLAQLAAGGVLAVQMPRNFSAPSHSAITDTVREGPWAARLSPLLRPTPVHTMDAYHAILAPRCAQLDLWETEYLHVLDGPDPVLEWTRGTTLTPLLGVLEPRERADFEAAYAERLRRHYPRNPQGQTLFSFRRLFLVATTASASQA